MFKDEKMDQGCAGLSLTPDMQNGPMMMFFFLPHQPKFITDECSQGNNVTILGVKMRIMGFISRENSTLLPPNLEPQINMMPRNMLC